MPEPAGRGLVRRIVTAIPATGEVAPLLRLAARMAGECNAMVEAVLVHNEALVRLASLPVTRHLLAATGAAEPLTAQTLRLAMAASGQRLRQELDAILGAARVRWTLHTLADHTEAGPPVPIQSEDLLLISAEARVETWFPPAPSTEPAVIAFAIRAVDDGRLDVVTVHDGTDAGWRALETALLLARAQDGCCHVVVPEDVPPDTQQHIREALANAGLPCHATSSATAGLPDLMLKIQAVRADIVVLPARTLAQPGLTAALRQLASKPHGRR